MSSKKPYYSEVAATIIEIVRYGVTLGFDSIVDSTNGYLDQYLKLSAGPDRYPAAHTEAMGHLDTFLARTHPGWHSREDTMAWLGRRPSDER